MKRGAWFAVAFLALLAGPAPAPASGQGRAVLPESRVREGLRRVLASTGPTQGRYGIHVCDARSGATVFGAAEQTVRIPASAMKLVTTGAAVLELGFDYEFRTEVRVAHAPDESGRVEGDLSVRGGGDPSLRSDVHLSELVRQIRAAGIRRVTGDLVLDDTAFDRVLRHPDWPSNQLSRSYCAPVGGLSLDRGCVRVRVLPGRRPGSGARVELIPPTSALRVEHAITTTEVRAQHRLVLEADFPKRVIRGRGKCWIKSTGYETEISVADPTEVFGDVLKRRLSEGGVVLAGVTRRGAARGGEVVASVATKLFPVVHTANRESENHFAECLLKLLGSLRAGEGSFGAGVAVTAGLAERIGAPSGQMVQADGSGLSRENRVSPYFLTRLLGHLYRSGHAERFLRSLAAGGEKGGTLSKRLADLGGNVRAKTGTIRGVSALAGYVRAKSGRVYCFAVLVNDPKTALSKSRRLQDEVCRVLYRER